MCRQALFVLLFAMLLAASASAADRPADTDGDGILDANEEILGTDPTFAEPLQRILDEGEEPEDRRKQDGYDASKDFLTIEFCNVAENRYLWRATMAAPPQPENTVFHLYIDADADAATGRKEAPTAPNTGTEYMVTMAGGRGYTSVYDADGNRSSGPAISYAVQGNSLLISADLDIGRDEQGIRYALYVLCHTMTQPGQSARMSDSSGKEQISGVPISSRKKILRPSDYDDNHLVDATFGHELLQSVLADKSTHVVPCDQLHTDGFSVDLFTTRRWPHLKLESTPATAWTKPPAAGRFHVGFMMYDDSADDRVGIYVDGQLRGVTVANKDNNTTWLYWLHDAIELTGNEQVEVRGLGGSGKHGIANIVFLANPPEIRNVRYSVESMAAVVASEIPGRAILSWITTWPSPTRLEYGLNAKYGRTIEIDAPPCLVHRVVLDGLDTNASYHARATGVDRNGKSFVGDDFVFNAAPPPIPETQEEATSVPLTVRNPHPFAVQRWPVTTGVPVPEGRLGTADHVRLLGPDGEVPAQVGVTARWPDESVKWLLISFQADAAAGGQSEYQLEFGRAVHPSPAPSGLSITQEGKALAIDTGAIRFRVDAYGNLTGFQDGRRALLPQDASCQSQAIDADGVQYTTADGDAEIELEEPGPLRAVVKVTSHLASPDGKPLFRIEKRVEAYRGAAYLRVHHTLVVDRPEQFTNFKSLSYRLPATQTIHEWQVPLEDGETLTLDAATSGLRQRFDDELVTIGSGDSESPQKGRAIGTIESGGPQGFSVAVRDFWQNYPKGFAVSSGRLEIGLCPPFAAGLYDKFPFEKEGHHLYYYLLDGQYRLKQGVSKTHELLLAFGPDSERRQDCVVFQRPLLATAPPEWYCGSGAFYSVATRDPEHFKLYEEAIDKNLSAYAAARERQHDFGMHNYGDWYGERGTNWGNIEYDTQHAFFLEYVRSGNPAAFFLGEAAEIHNRDIDTVHWSADRNRLGMVYIHQMCHVGGYYDRSVPGSLGFPSGGSSVSHAWVEGHFDHYFLTGDRRSLETARAVADYFVRKELGRPYDFSSVRVPGWHLILNAAAQAATGDPYYANASKVIVDHVLELQDRLPFPLPEYQQEGRKPYQIGGWSRMMVPGHCQCEPRHRGNAGFMVAILLSGLKYYHDATGDDRVKDAIIRGAHYLLDETYSDEVHGFRYTSCPNTGYRAGASPLMAEGVARAYLWTGDERLRRVLTDALPRSAGGAGYGKSFSMYYRMAPRVLADLNAAGIKLDQRPSE